MLALALVSLLAAAPPAPQRWVTDEAGLLSPAARQALDQRLEAFDRQTGKQVLVWIGKTTGGEPIESFAAGAFQAWKVGNGKLDDGVVLFVFPEDRSLRLEVGYGLEPVLPDAAASRIIRERIAPQLAAGQPDAAITSGVDAVLAAVGGEASQGPITTPQLSTPHKIGVGVLVAGFLLLLILRPGLALRLLAMMFFFRRGGGPGGGGFSGRGGRSGGGGASGRW